LLFSRFYTLWFKCLPTYFQCSARIPIYPWYPGIYPSIYPTRRYFRVPGVSGYVSGYMPRIAKLLPRLHFLTSSYIVRAVECCNILIMSDSPLSELEGGYESYDTHNEPTLPTLPTPIQPDINHIPTPLQLQPPAPGPMLPLTMLILFTKLLYSRMILDTKPPTVKITCL
jgi:hypothetical protein